MALQAVGCTQRGCIFKRTFIITQSYLEPRFGASRILRASEWFGYFRGLKGRESIAQALAGFSLGLYF